MQSRMAGNVVSQADLFEAVEVVLVGKEKKDRIMNAEERRIVSYHEVGHALVSALRKKILSQCRRLPLCQGQWELLVMLCIHRKKKSS